MKGAKGSKSQSRTSTAARSSAIVSIDDAEPVDVFQGYKFSNLTQTKTLSIADIIDKEEKGAPVNTKSIKQAIADANE